MKIYKILWHFIFIRFYFCSHIDSVCTFAWIEFNLVECCSAHLLRYHFKLFIADAIAPILLIKCVFYGIAIIGSLLILLLVVKRAKFSFHNIKRHAAAFSADVRHSWNTPVQLCIFSFVLCTMHSMSQRQTCLHSANLEIWRNVQKTIRNPKPKQYA